MRWARGIWAVIAVLALHRAAAAVTTEELAEALARARLPEADVVAALPGTVEESRLEFADGATYFKVILHGGFGPEILHFVRQRDRLIAIPPGAEGRTRIASDLELSVRSADAALAYVRWLLDTTAVGSFRRVESVGEVPFVRTTSAEKNLRARIDELGAELERKIEPPRAEALGSAFVVVQDAIAARRLVRYTVKVSKLGLATIEETAIVRDLPVVYSQYDVAPAAESAAPIVARVPGAAVEGTVTLPERPEAPQPKPRYQFKTSGRIAPPDPPAAVVYLEDSSAPAARSALKRSQVTQLDYKFAPGLLPVEKGTVVAFPNLDDEYHSVYSFSAPKRFDLGRYHKQEHKQAEVTFDQPGLVEIFCDIHDHMRGEILVLETPYFQKTAPDGRYRLEGLPAGRHLVKAWVGKQTVWERSVELRDGETLRVDFP
jgi:plastocyanin